MDKKTIIGFVLIGVILFGFSFWQSKESEKAQAAYLAAQREQFVADSIDRAEHPEKYLHEVAEQIDDQQQRAEAMAAIEAQNEARLEAKLVENFGQQVVDAMHGQEQFYTLENDVMTVVVSSHGAKVVDVTLKDYRRYEKGGNGPLVKLFDPESVYFDLSFYMRNGYSESKINTANFYFASAGVEHLGDDEVLSMWIPMGEDAKLVVSYSMRPDDYMVDMDVQFVGMASWMQTTTSFDIDWRNTSYQNERGYQNENMYTTISYLYPENRKVDKLGIADTKRGGGSKRETIATEFEWFAFQQQFFSSILIAPEGFSNGELAYDSYKPGSGYIKDFMASVSVPFDDRQDSYNLKFYFGPNKFSTLKSYDIGLEKIVQLGGRLVSWVNRWIVIPVFDFLSRFISNYGIIILLLTLFIKLLIFPLTYKSYMSSAKMRALRPEIAAIQAKYPKAQTDQQEMMKSQQATMELYKKCGVSPMGGCLPMLIQFPVLIAMFRFFPTSIELRGQKFLWADDLSTYDSILNLPFNIPWYGDHVSLFALIMTVTMFFYSKYNYEQTSQSGPQMPGMKFMMVWMMPIMMLMWMNNYASGLCYYYFLSQIITMIQMWAFRVGINEDKLHAKMVANTGKPAKKSKWQQRLEEAQRMQEQQRREMEKRQRRTKR